MKKMEVYLAAAPSGFRQACRAIEELERSNPQDFEQLMVSSCTSLTSVVDFVKRGLMKFQVTENDLISCLNPYLSPETAASLFSNYQSTPQNIEIDQLKEIKWKMGQRIASDSSQEVKTPFVQLQLTLQSNERSSMEMSSQQFDEFQNLVHRSKH